MNNALRYKALLLSVLPLLVAGFLVFTQVALHRFDYLLAIIFAIPVLTAVSTLSVFLAFNEKDLTLKLATTTKVLSLTSMMLFGAVCAVGLYWMTASLLR